MRAPEEVAREMLAAAEQTYDALREFGPKMSPGEVRERMIYAIATHLRARDAEVRADERAKVLAGFTEETRTLDDGYSGWDGDDRGGHAVHKAATRQRRLVGPWQPDDEP